MRPITFDPRAQAKREERARLNAIRNSMIATQPKAPFALTVAATFIAAFCVMTIALMFVS